MRNRLWLTTFLLATWTAQSAVLVDNFESYDPGTITAPWVITDGTPTVGEEAGSNRYLESFGSYRDLNGASISSGDSETTVFYRVYKSAAYDPDCSVGLSDFSEPTGDWNDFEAYIVIVGNDLRARNGSSNASLMTISDNTWYNIWLVVNNSAQTYDVYVTTGAADATVGDRQANNFDFRSGNDDSPADLISFKVYGRSTDGPIRIDDISLSSGTDLSIPEQTAAAPVIVASPSDVTVNETQQAVFETVFTSDTTPAIEWYKVDASSDIYMDPAQSDINVQTTYDSGSEQYTTTLTMTALTTSDSGQYYCRVNNESGFPRKSETADLLVYGTVAHWTLDQARYSGGFYMEDIAGFNAAVNGTPSFITGVDGTANGAVQISATDGWALCPTFDPVQQSGQMTVSFWANWSDTQATQRDLIAESTSETLTMTNGLKSDGQWQHVCTVFDGATGKLYVDGTLQDQTAWVLPTETEAAINIGINNDTQNAFIGGMDDVRLYNYALTETQVAALYDAVNGGCAPGFDGTYDFTGSGGSPDCVVDIMDLAELANYFLTNDTGHDLTGPAGTPDGIVDMHEYAGLASAWLTEGL